MRTGIDSRSRTRPCRNVLLVDYFVVGRYGDQYYHQYKSLDSDAMKILFNVLRVDYFVVGRYGDSKNNTATII